MIGAADLAGRLQKARRSGGGWVALCPAHEDREPSLSITTGKTGATLLKCHAGCEFDAITRSLGIETKELMPDSEPWGLTETANPIRDLRLVATYAYRDAAGETIARKLRYVDSHGVKTFRWERPEGERWVPGGHVDAPLYRLPELRGAAADELLVIVEGEKDVDRLASLGIVATTTPNGAAAKWRESDSEHFAERRVAIIADDDEPGRKKAAITKDALSGIAAAVGVVTLPNPKQKKGFDASDFLDDGGTVAQLRQALERFDVAPLPAEIATAEVIETRVLDLWRAGGPQPGVFPGWQSLAPLFRPKIGQLYTITGSPNAGKSTWLDDLIVRTSCADDGPTDAEKCARWRWVVFSAEQYPVERHVSMLLQKLVRKPFTEGRSARMQEPEVKAALGVLREFVEILDPRFSSLTIERILDIAADLNAREKRHALLVDPYNVLAATSRGKGESEHDFINAFLTKLRTFAQAEQMAVFVVAHPTKLRREEGESEYPVVRPWDISGSAHWYNHSDAIVSLWRPMKDEARVARGEVEVHVSKIRFQPECGTIGMARLLFDRVTTKYLEPGELHHGTFQSADAA